MAKKTVSTPLIDRLTGGGTERAQTAPATTSSNDDYLRQYAAATGADYNLLRSGQSGADTSGILKKYGFDGLPGVSPAATQIAQQTTAATNPYSNVQDYIDYYTRLGRQPDMSYEQWVSRQGSSGVPANATNVPSAGYGANNQAQQIVDDSYNAYMQRLQQISQSTGIPLAQLVQMGAITGNYGSWQNGTLVVRDPNTGNTYTPGGSIAPDGLNSTPGNGITGTFPDPVPGGDQTDQTSEQPAQMPTSPQFSAFLLDNRDRINAMYDAQIAAQRAALQEQGDQALSDAQANRDKIADTYNAQRNAASVDWERQRRNFLESAATSGLNTGAGSQAELSMMSMGQRTQNDLGAAQAGAEIEADRNIADIKRSTQAAINEAVAKNDYQRAAALLDEYQNIYKRYAERAEALASYGDFTGYAALYGNELASQMFYNWAANNPQIAYMMGAISDQQYNNLRMGYPINAEGASYDYSGGGNTNDDPWGYGGSGWNYSGGGNSGGNSGGTVGGTNGVNTSMGNMTPASYAAYVNSLVAAGELDGATGQALIREAYAFVP